MTILLHATDVLAQMNRIKRAVHISRTTGTNDSGKSFPFKNEIAACILRKKKEKKKKKKKEKKKKKKEKKKKKKKEKQESQSKKYKCKYTI